MSEGTNAHPIDADRFRQHLLQARNQLQSMDSLDAPRGSIRKRSAAETGARADLAQLLGFLKQLLDPLPGTKTLHQDCYPFIGQDFLTELSDAVKAADEFTHDLPGKDEGDRDEQYDAIAERMRRHVLQALQVFDLGVGAAAESLDVAEFRQVADGITADIKKRYNVRDLERARAQGLKEAREQGLKDLGHYFDEVARGERRFAEALRALAAASLVSIFALSVSQFRPELDLSLGQQLSHLAVALPLAALAGYLGRQSGHHRAAALDAKQTAVRLRTLPLFAKNLGGTAGEEFWVEVGRGVFTKPEQLDEQKIVGVFSEMTDLMAKLGQASANLVSSASGQKPDETSASPQI
ncbi:hypothetical protein [Pseudonocardia lacus]|uniref:hypothetical protein n=1 Tax=Pseudonocardia lacus TaxID=2835865 RepID=UPI001BDDA57D|nr:hypothetical protein [Pseudonocardia lacus]